MFSSFPIARLVTLLLILIGPVTTASAQELRAIVPATESKTGRELCVIRDRVVELEPEKCRDKQLEERRLANVLGAALDQLSLDISTPTLSLDLLEGVTLGAQYRLQIDPSYRDRFYTRIDRYRLDTDIRPGDWLPGLPIGLAIDSGSEIVFAQQFASGAEARNPLNGYLPDRLPLSAGRALQLKPGDYVRFDAHLNLLARIGQLFDSPLGLLDAQVSASGLLSGEFQVHVFRLGGERVRIKLVAERGRTAKVQSGVSPDIPPALFALDERAQALIALEDFDRQVSAALANANQSVFLVDYTLDLAEPRVREAYDRLFSGKLAIGARALAKVTSSHGNLKHALIASIADFDQLQRSEDGVAPSVVRNFKGAAAAHSRQLDFKLALRSYAVERQRIFREKLLSRVRTSDDGAETTDYFLLPSWTRTRQRSALFGHLQEASLQTADAIFSADNSGHPLAFQNIGFRFLYEDSKLRVSEYRRLREKIELLLPDAGEQALAMRLERTNWLTESALQDVRISLNYFFRESALRALETRGFAEKRRLQLAITDFVVAALANDEFLYFDGNLDTFIKRYSVSVAPRRGERRDPRAYAKRIVRVLWGKEISVIASRLAVALDSDAEKRWRLDAFKSLRFSAFYRAISGGLWVHLVNEAELDLSSSLYLELNLQAQGRETVEFTYGDDSERELFDAIQFIDALLNERGIDMREPGRVDSIVSRLAVTETSG